MRGRLLSLSVVALALLAGCDRTDRSFGTDGVSRFGFEPTDAVARDGASGFVAAGQLRGSDQVVVASISAAGVVRWDLPLPRSFEAVDPAVTFAGDAFNVVGTTDGEIEVAQVRDERLVTSYGDGGIASTDVEIDAGSSPVALTDSQQRTVVVGQRDGGFVYAVIDGDGDVSREVAITLEQNTATFTDAVMVAGDKVLVAYARHIGSQTDFVVARLLPSGAVDKTFGGNGIATIDAKTDMEPHSIVVRPDGRFVVAGVSIGEQNQTQLLLAGFTADGALDPAFGLYGLSVVDDVAAAWPPHIVAGGPGFVVAMTVAGGDVVTRGFTQAGLVDDAWGDGGRQVHDLGGAASVADVVQRADRTIVLTSTVDAPGGAMLAVK